MTLNIINEYFIENFLKYIIFLILLIIILISVISVNNVFLYIIYNINSIFKKYVYENSIFIKLKDIYSFMFINYIYSFDKKNGSVLKLVRDNKKYYINDTKNIKFKDDIDKIFLYIQERDSDKTPEKNDTIILTKNEANLLKNIIEINDKNIMLKSDYKSETDSVYYKYKAIYDCDNNYNTSGINDNKSSYLYIHICNNFYEFILFLIFIIIIILFSIFIFELCIVFINSVSRTPTLGSNIFIYMFQNNNEYILTIIVVFIYCILHSVIYKNIFIDNMYNSLYNHYTELIKPDIYIRAEINNIYNFINNNDNLDIKEYLYDNNINILKILAKDQEYNIVDSLINENDSRKIQNDVLNNYIDKSLNINLSFKIYNYKSNEKIFKYIEHILNKNPSNYYLINQDYITSSIFLYVIYSYFIYNNEEDPHIINKLNKLLLNEKVIIGNNIIDDEIEYTLLLRSLLINELEDDKIQGDINSIMEEVMNVYEEYHSLNIIKYTGDIHNKDILLSLKDQKMPSNIKIEVKKKINNFCLLLKETNNNINFGYPIYFFNIYLLLELSLHFLVIISICIILYIYISEDKINEISANIISKYKPSL